MALLTEWLFSLGLMEVRADPQHCLLNKADVQPSEESVGQLCEPLSMLAAQFGCRFPAGSKFKVGSALLYSHESHARFFQ